MLASPVVDMPNMRPLIEGAQQRSKQLAAASWLSLGQGNQEQPPQVMIVPQQPGAQGFEAMAQYGNGAPAGSGGQTYSGNYGDAGSIYRQELLDNGVPAHVVEGIMMNAQDESNFNPAAVGDNGAAFGLLQWNGPRKRALEQFAAQQGMSPGDPRLQARFTIYEGNGPEKAAWNALMGTTTAGQAAAVFVNQFERPAEVHRARREAKYLAYR